MLRNGLIFTVTVATFLLIWQAAVQAFAVPLWLLPAPLDIWRAFLIDREYLMPHLWITGLSALGGIVIGALAGIGLAIAMLRWRMAEKLLMPLLVIDQSVPKIAVAPLLIIWFGSGFASRIGIAVVISFFPVIIGALQGFRSIDRRLGRLMHTLSASWINVLLKVRLPNAVPRIFSAIRISVPLAVTGAVVAEYVQSNSGLGFVIMLSLTEYKTQRLFVCVALLSITCLALYALVMIVERALLGRRHFVLMKAHSMQ